MTLRIFFDIETTGLPKRRNVPYYDVENWPHIVALSWQIYDDHFNQIGNNNYIIKPIGYKIPEDSSNIHGITHEYAKKNGLILREVLNKFMEIKEIIEINDDIKEYILIAHNIEFDINVLKAAFIREKLFEDLALLNTFKLFCNMKNSTDFCKIIPTSKSRSKKDNEITIDTKDCNERSEIEKKIKNVKYKWPRLGELYEKLFNEKMENAHNCEKDVNNLVKCYFELINIGYYK